MKAISAVLLNYNSEQDLIICAEQLATQVNVNLSLIIVDNGSQTESLARVRAWLSGWRSNAVCGTYETVRSWITDNPVRSAQPGNVYLIENFENRGYSAGNNLGLRIAQILGSDAVLIANPDMRIEDPAYLSVLSQHLFAYSDNLIAASRILDTEGEDQNPLREAGFWEELCWPRWYLRRYFKKITNVLPLEGDMPVVVPKVSGCCMLLRTDFMNKIGYLDENVFLYCEEPILSAQVLAAQGNIIYVPTVSAIHAHVRSRKGEDSRRMKQFIKSRKYYLGKYSNYNSWQLVLLFLSYFLLELIIRVRAQQK